MKNSWTFALLALGLTAPAAEGAEEAGEGTRPVPTHRVVAGPEYKASALHRALFGSGYRKLWVTPIVVEVLDLATFSGGLTAEKKSGGKQTKGLRFEGADGRKWSFRSVNKDPSPILPKGLQRTFVDAIVQDQISASLPANGLIVDGLADAAGLLHVSRRLVVLPDDARLGEFRKEFAGMLGTIEERPRLEPPVTPGFGGFTKLVDTEELEKILDADPRERVDSAAFLRARLFDVLIGDYDRHKDQWDWAKDGASGRWVPVPRDRDLAFVKFDGLVLDLVRRRSPQLVNFSDDDLSVLGLTWQGRFLDRRHLSDLEWPAWQQAVNEVLKPLTDRTIDEAVRRLPPPYHQLVGATLAAQLKARRARLADFAGRFYAQLAREPEVHATDEADTAQLLHRGDGSLELVLVGTAGPYFRRTFSASETDEVRVFLKQGDDRAFSEGRNGDIKPRVVGDGGDDALDDSAGGHTYFYDSSGTDRVVKGPGTSYTRRPFTPVLDRQGNPERDWGSSTGVAPTVAWSGDYGFLFGATLTHTRYGFRQHPFAARHTLRAGYSTRITGGDVRYEYESVRSRDNRGRFNVLAKATALDVIHYYGFGNETTAGSDAFHEVKERQFSLFPAYRLDLTGVDIRVGPVAKYSDVTPEPDTLLGIEQPYGQDGFGQVGARLDLTVDRRDPEMLRAGGAMLNVGGTYYAPVWSVTDSFGEAHSEVALIGGIAAIPGRPTLAVRAGGRKLFGRYPFHEAAALGGYNTLRGLPRQRYIGDAAAWGNAELRIFLRQKSGAFLPHLGVFGLADAGRVFLEGETSDRWHTAVGGGFWLAVMDPRSTVSLTVARSEGRTRVYLHSGLQF